MSVISIKPKQGEQYAAFIARAHSDLMSKIPDPYRRNNAVWRSWESVHGNAVADRAGEYFPPEQYRHVPAVCYFREHTAAKRGKPPYVYDFKELARIVEAANDRCDTDTYSAISSHHTGEEKGPDVEPFVAGYTGVHRLGMIGRNKPKWAIFVDEYHDKDHSKMFAERRRRSVEVLRDPEGRRAPYFDPISTLGADSPRLPLPVAQYANDCEVDRYILNVGSDVESDQYMVPDFAQAGPSNTYIPGSSSNRRKDFYQSGADPMDSQQPNGPGTSSLTPDDVQAIIAALFATPQMQFLNELMEQRGAQTADTSGQQPGVGDQQQPVGQPTQPDQTQANDQDLDNQDDPVVGQQNVPSAANKQPSQPQSMPYLSVQTGAGSGFSKQRYSATSQEDNEMDPERYAALETELHETRDKYSALAEVNERNVQQIGELRKSLVQLEARNVDADRTQVIKDLYAAYPHMVDVEEELNQTLYSRGASMDQEAFTAHVASIERYAKRAPLQTTIVPGGDVTGRASSKTVETESKVAEMTVERYSQYANKGDIRDYDAIEREIRVELGLATATA